MSHKSNQRRFDNDVVSRLARATDNFTVSGEVDVKPSECHKADIVGVGSINMMTTRIGALVRAVGGKGIVAYLFRNGDRNRVSGFRYFAGGLQDPEFKPHSSYVDVCEVKADEAHSDASNN